MKTIKIGTRDFQTRGATYVMGILNVTPDSFSDGGKFNHMDAALHHVEEMLVDGMDVLDIGGESSRPGYTKLSDQEEIDRVAPIIEAVKARFDVPVWLDTYKSAVAEAGLKAGADLINDIWGLKYDEKMGPVIAKYGVPCCLMHNRENSDYRMLIPDICADLEESLSSVCVVSNALRLRFFKPKHTAGNSTSAASPAQIPPVEIKEAADEEKGDEGTMKKVLNVEGMMCQHCQARVEKALSEVRGVKSAVVDLDAKTATVECGLLVSDKALTQAVTDAGYEVKGIQ